jgi:hypothetical protein
MPIFWLPSHQRTPIGDPGGSGNPVFNSVLTELWKPTPMLLCMASGGAASASGATTATRTTASVGTSHENRFITSSFSFESMTRC